MAFNDKKKNIKDLDNVFQIIEKREGTEETDEEKEIRQEKNKEIKKIRLGLIAVLIILILVSGIYVAYTIYEASNEDYMLLKSRYRTELTLRNVDSTLLTNYLQPGQKTIVAFWASWCPHCQAESQELNKFITFYKDVNVIVISHDRGIDVLTKYFENNPSYKWFILYDIERKIRDSIDPKLNSIPLTYLLDDKGNVLDKISGEVTFDSLKDLYEQKNNTQTHN